MRQALRFLARLYPRSWRQRYGDEFDVLLEDATLRWPDLFDVLSDALKMRVSTLGFWKMAVTLGLLGALTAGAISLAIPDRWISTAVLMADTAHQVNRTAVKALNRKSLSQLIQQENLYASERGQMPLDDVVEKMKRNIRIAPVSSAPAPNQNSGAFEVSFVYENPDKSQRVVANLVSAMIEANLHLAGEEGRMAVIDPANVPQLPIYPNRMFATEFGFAAGLLLALALAFFGGHRLRLRS